MRSTSWSPVSRLQVTSCVSSSGVVCNHSRQKPLPPLCMVPDMTPLLYGYLQELSRGAEVEWWGGHLPKMCAQGGVCLFVCLVCSSRHNSRPRHVRYSTRGSTCSICHMGQVVIRHVLLITESLLAQELATDTGAGTWGARNPADMGQVVSSRAALV